MLRTAGHWYHHGRHGGGRKIGSLATVLLSFLFLVLIVVVPRRLFVHSMSVVERRRCVLKQWGFGGNEKEEEGSSSTIIGWTLEEKTELGDLRVMVGLGDDDDEMEEQPQDSSSLSDHSHVTIDLIRTPTAGDDAEDYSSDNHMAAADDLASSLWDAGIAGAILERHYANALKIMGSSSSAIMVDDRRVLELGCGLGLCGWTATARAKSVTLTDHDETAIERLTALIEHKNNENKKNENEEEDVAGDISIAAAAAAAANVSAQYLEWRDETDELLRGKFDWIIGTDVAYYFFLLRPLMDTIQACLSDEAHSKLLVVGQANRESQWDLYDNLVDGCYNQLTDEREPPWQGKTRMVLYQLEMSEWIKNKKGDDSSSDDNDSTIDKNTKFDLVDTVPIAALLYEREPNSPDFLTERDRVATPEDREGMFMSF